ncbi:MAG: DUF6599 family protein [Chloroflexota bacterium]|nr:DUF6599 family protein [Anaerolineales bacterium]
MCDEKGIRWIVAVLGSILVLTACVPSAPTAAPLPLDTLLPADGSIPGWDAPDAVLIYERDNLYNLVDGQADAFFAYGFEQVAVQRYQNTAGTCLNVEIWQLANPADAYGLFHSGMAGQPAAIGVEGDSDPGRRLAFWQERYFVSLTTLEAIPDETLWTFAKEIAQRLPSGGECPTIVKRLPAEGLVENSALFFHEEISIQMEIWLGGENILGLSQDTNGVVARYAWGDQKARLLLVEYPSADDATQGLKALQSSEIKDIIASDVKGTLLAAMVGKVDADKAQALLQEALQ